MVHTSPVSGLPNSSTEACGRPKVTLRGVAGVTLRTASKALPSRLTMKSLPSRSKALKAAAFALSALMRLASDWAIAASVGGAGLATAGRTMS